MATFWIAEALRLAIGPRDVDVLLWWPAMQTHSMAVILGVFAAVLLGGAAAAYGRVWPLVRWPWVGLFATSAGLAALSLDSDVRVFADRIEFSGSVAGAPQRSLQLDKADLVVVECREVYRRRREHFSTIDYAVHFPGTGWVDLSPARRDGVDGASGWFTAVSRLDELGLREAPHAPVRDPDPGCIRRLRANLGDEQFTVARQMMGLSDVDFLRYYSEPHEAYNQKVQHGQ